MLLHTHSVMSFILGLTAAGMFMHLITLRQPVNAKRWLVLFYFSLMCWQVENIIRYSMPLEYFTTTLYKLQTVVFLIPLIAVTLVAHTQFAYRFLATTYKREQKIVFRISIFLSVAEVLFVAWNEFYNNGGMAITLLSAFFYGLFFTFWIIILSIRKSKFLRHTDPKASRAHLIYAAINSLYAGASIFSLMFGFFSVPGFWSYFLLVWIGNLASIVLYIVTAAIPASFQTKITGFTFVLAATFLSLITLFLYPPVFLTDTEGRLSQQGGLIRMLIIIAIAAFLIVLLMPFMLRISLTTPMQRLIEGVQKVNSGNFNAQIEVGLPDEIGLLTENFNQMTRHLEKAQNDLTDYAQTLEKKVARRTEQLQRSFAELKTLQAQQIQAEKIASLAQLTAGLGHEIKNPLNFINNFSQVSIELAGELEEEINKSSPDPQYLKEIAEDIILNLERIHHHGQRADGIVQGMLDHSRAEKGERKLTDLNSLTDEYRRLTYDSIITKDKFFSAKMVTHYDDSIAEINIVKEDIGRVILNVFNNAFYSIKEKKKLVGNGYVPTIWVNTKKIDLSGAAENGLQKREAILIKIKDNGIGIPDKIIDKIYQPFFTTKPSGQGTGLGLSLSHDIIKAHGGSLKTNSTEGEFAEFEIMLPYS